MVFLNVEVMLWLSSCVLQRPRRRWHHRHPSVKSLFVCLFFQVLCQFFLHFYCAVCFLQPE